MCLSLGLGVSSALCLPFFFFFFCGFLEGSKFTKQRRKWPQLTSQCVWLEVGSWYGVSFHRPGAAQGRGSHCPRGSHLEICGSLCFSSRSPFSALGTFPSSLCWARGGFRPRRLLPVVLNLDFPLAIPAQGCSNLRLTRLLCLPLCSGHAGLAVPRA